MRPDTAAKALFSATRNRLATYIENLMPTISGTKDWLYEVEDGAVMSAALADLLQINICLELCCDADCDRGAVVAAVKEMGLSEQLVPSASALSAGFQALFKGSEFAQKMGVPVGCPWLHKTQHGQHFRDQLTTLEPGQYAARSDLLTKAFTSKYEANGKLIHLDSPPSDGNDKVLAQTWLLSLLREERLMSAMLLKMFAIFAMKGPHGIEIVDKSGKVVQLYEGGVPTCLKDFSAKVIERAVALGAEVGGDADGGVIVCSGEQTRGSGALAETTHKGATSGPNFSSFVCCAIKSSVDRTLLSALRPLGPLFKCIDKVLECPGPRLLDVKTFLRHLLSTEADVGVPEADYDRLVALEGALPGLFPPSGIQTRMMLYNTSMQVLPLSQQRATRAGARACAAALLVVLQQHQSDAAPQSEAWLKSFDHKMDELDCYYDYGVTDDGSDSSDS